MASEDTTLVTCDNCEHTWEYSGVKWQVPCPSCETPTATGLSGVDDGGDDPDADREPDPAGERGTLTVDTGGTTVAIEVVVRVATGADGYAVESARLPDGDRRLTGRRRRAALAEYLRQGGRATLALDAGPEVFEVRPRFTWALDDRGEPYVDGLSVEVLDRTFDRDAFDAGSDPAAPED